MFQCLVCSVVNLSSWEPETACDLPKTKQQRCCHRSPELTTSSPNLAFKPTLIDIGVTSMHIDLILAKLAVALSLHLADRCNCSSFLGWTHLDSLQDETLNIGLVREAGWRVHGTCATIVWIFRQHCPGHWVPDALMLASLLLPILSRYKQHHFKAQGMRKHCSDHRIRTRITTYTKLMVMGYKPQPWNENTFPPRDRPYPQQSGHGYLWALARFTSLKIQFLTVLRSRGKFLVWQKLWIFH